MEKYILEMEHISKEFSGVKALDDVTFRVKQGEIHALVGENGAGKSTLMKVLSGVYANGQYSGRMLVDGEEQVFENTKDAERAGIAIIYQELNLIPYLSVAENIYLGRYPRRKNGGIDWKKLYADSEQLMRDMELNIDVHAMLDTLGAAAQQMVSIVRAVSCNAKLVLLDEPTSALDPELVGEVLDVIKKVAAQGYTMLLVSHEMNFIRHVSNRVIFLDKGHVVEDGTPKEVFEHPQNQRTREFFSKMHIMAQPEYVI